MNGLSAGIDGGNTCWCQHDHTFGNGLPQAFEKGGLSRACPSGEKQVLLGVGDNALGALNLNVSYNIRRSGDAVAASVCKDDKRREL